MNQYKLYTIQSLMENADIHDLLVYLQTNVDPDEIYTDEQLAEWARLNYDACMNRWNELEDF